MSNSAGNGSLSFGNGANGGGGGSVNANEGLYKSGSNIQLGQPGAGPWTAITSDRNIFAGANNLNLAEIDGNVLKWTQYGAQQINQLFDDSGVSGITYQSIMTPGNLFLIGGGNPGPYLSISNQSDLTAMALGASDNNYTNAKKNAKTYLQTVGATHGINPINMVFATGVDSSATIHPDENDFIWMDGNFFTDNASRELMRLTRDGSFLIGTDTVQGPGVMVIRHYANDYYPALIVETDPAFDNYLTMIIKGRQDQLYITTSDRYADIVMNTLAGLTTMVVGSDTVQNAAYVRADNGLVFDIEGTAGSKLARFTQVADLQMAGNISAGNGILIVPSAKVDIGPGAAAPGKGQLKLRPGSLLTTPEDGILEYNGTHLYFTIGATRIQIV